MSIRFITDSTTDMAPGIGTRVKVLPISVRFGEQEFRDGVDLTSEKFYEMLTESEAMPTTSQVTPLMFEEAFREAVEAGDEVVCITVAAQLSGTCQSAFIAAAQFPDKVFVVDSGTVIMGAGILLEYAVKLAEEGLSAREIAEKVEGIKDRVRIVAVADTLEYLKKGGRISATVAFAGGLLNIKPILGVADGEVGLVNKARGAKQINTMMMKAIANYGGIDCTYPMMFGYTGLDDSLLLKFMEEAAPLWQDYQGEIVRTIVGCAVGTHAGPGAAAIAFFTKN